MYTEKDLEKARNWKGMGLLIVGFGIFAAIGLYFAFASSKAKHEVAMSWPTVEGKVVKSAIKKKKKLNRVGRRAVVDYEYDHVWSVRYEVDGQSYVRDYTDNHSTEQAAERGQRERKKGSTAVMHYNPENHGESRVHKDKHDPPEAAFLFGGFICAIGLVVFAVFRARENTIKAELGIRIQNSLRPLSNRERRELEPEEDVLQQVNEMPSLDSSELETSNLDSAKYFNQMR